MSGIKRKLKRNKIKRKIKETKKDLQQKIGLFGKLADQCLICSEPFDKKSREQVTTWTVVVKEKQEKVNLYCPECWGRANKIIEEIKNDIRISPKRGSKTPEESKS